MNRKLHVVWATPPGAWCTKPDNKSRQKSTALANDGEMKTLSTLVICRETLVKRCLPRPAVR